ncbi:MAG: hypothetical protein K9H64_02235 [Bacteroidales bacterium]|nr:hypothetical protein [Bacteroidales bacterium]MCF8454634.1 hypothetical protein [Bacteroidales bacterium]
MEKALQELIPVFQNINKQEIFCRQKYNALFSSISKDKKDSIENFISYLSYRDFQLEIDSIFAKNSLPIVFSDTGDFKNSVESLKRLLGYSSYQNQLANFQLKNASDFFGSDHDDGVPSLMVNLQQEAEHDVGYLKNLIACGVRHFRVNCAFGSEMGWERTHRNLQKAAGANNEEANLLFDLAGPKIRIEKLFENHTEVNSIDIEKTENLIIFSKSASALKLPGSPDFIKGVVSSIDCDFSVCHPNEIIRFDDSCVEARIIETGNDFLRVSVEKVSQVPYSLLPGKGINFPESDLGISGLTKKDQNDLASVVHLDGTLCFSFVQSAADIIDIEKEISKYRKPDMPVVIKIETFKAVRNLEEIILAAMRFPKVALLIARGDLVSECGWAALPEIQEKISKLGRAAHLPIILATEILESYNQNGLHTRPEMIDLHHARKFDCLLLNKGPNIFDTMDYVRGLI